MKKMSETDIENFLRLRSALDIRERVRGRRKSKVAGGKEERAGSGKESRVSSISVGPAIRSWEDNGSTASPSPCVS